MQDTFLLLTLLWSSHSLRAPGPVLLALSVDAASLLLDVIALSVRFPHGGGSTQEFSAVMAIFNLVVR